MYYLFHNSRCRLDGSIEDYTIRWNSGDLCINLPYQGPFLECPVHLSVLFILLVHDTQIYSVFFIPLTLALPSPSIIIHLVIHHTYSNLFMPF